MNLQDIVHMTPCAYTYTDGPNIGRKCKVQSFGSRCAAHHKKPWPKQSYKCTRTINQGERAGQPCNKSTKFTDAKCATCRKRS